MRRWYGLVLWLLLLVVGCGDGVPELPLPTADVGLVMPTRPVQNGGEPTLPAIMATETGVVAVTPIRAEPTQPTVGPTAVATAVPTCTKRTEWPTYTVRDGDTLSGIANNVGLKTGDLAVANCLGNPNVLALGTVLHVPRAVVWPTAVPATAVPTAIAWEDYQDNALELTYRHPTDWERESSYNQTRFEGEGGFMEVRPLLSLLDLYDTAVNEARQVVLPYGRDALVEQIALSNGDRAYFIRPQTPSAEYNFGAIVTLYADPLERDGVTYNMVLMKATLEHLTRIAESLLPQPPDGFPVIEAFTATSEVVSGSYGARRVTFSWQTSGATHVTIINPETGHFAESRSVEADGTLVIETVQTAVPNPTMRIEARNEVTGEVRTATVQMVWPCPYPYFVAVDEPNCAEPVVEAEAVYQSFERGFMVRVPTTNPYHLEPPSIYVFDDTGQVRWYVDGWAEGQPESDPALVPPVGLLQPVRGFGKLWRENSWLSDSLGWATAMEGGYNVELQHSLHQSAPASYLRLPNGRVVRLVLADGSWEYAD